MTTSTLGNTITQSGASGSPDTLATITTDVSNTNVIEQVATGVFHLKASKILKLTGFTDFSGETLFVESNSNNFHFVGGNHQAGTKLRDGVYLDHFTLIYKQGVAQGKQHSATSSETDSVISGTPTITYYGWEVKEQAGSGYDGFNLIDDTAILDIQGLRLALKASKYVNIDIKVGSTLDIAQLTNATLRSHSTVPFKLKSWRGGETGSDAVKLAHSGDLTVDGLAVDYAQAGSELQILAPNLTLTLKNPMVSKDRYRGHLGNYVIIVNSITCNLSTLGVPVNDVLLHVEATSDNHIFHSAVEDDGIVIDVERWKGQRVGSNPSYAPFTTGVVDRIALTIKGVKYDSMISSTSLSEYLGEQTIALGMIVDATITEQDTATVAAYTEISTSAQFYDYAKWWLTQNYSGQSTALVSRTGDTIDAGSYDLVLDATASDVFALTGNTLTIKTSTFIGNITTIGTVTLNNAATIIGTIADAAGDATLTIITPPGYDDETKYFHSQADADAKTSVVASGAQYRYQTAVDGGSVIWLRVESADDQALIVRHTLPSTPGSHNFEILVTAIDIQLQNIMGSLSDLQTTANLAQRHARAANLQTRGRLEL